MTPCEERGYKIGDRFKVTNGDAFSHGSIVELYYDDRSWNPLFILISGACKYDSAGGNPGGFLNLDHVQPIGEEMDTKERIEKLEQELAELKRECTEEWEPEGGEWYVNSSSVVDTADSDDHSRLFGAERPTRQLAEKARDAMRIHNRALAYVHEHAPDWDAGEEEAHTVYLSGSGDYLTVADPHFSIGAVAGPEEVMRQLADDINSGRVKL